jgi:uncharacterized protein YcfL
MKKTLFLAIATASMALVGTGCQTPEGAYAPVNTTTGNYEVQSNFVLLDPGTQRSVTSPGIQTRTLPDGRLEVAANIRNRENRRIEVQVNCVFKDAQGFEVDSTPFETLILTENSIKTQRFVSANDQAKNFTVRVREAR